MSETCIFCQIANGQVPSRMVYEDQDTFAFLDNSPATPGHTLVVPRLHAKDIWDVSKSDAARVMEAVHQVAQILDNQLQPDGMTLFQANRPAGWQDVFHLHVHVVPRYNDDRLVPPWRSAKAADADLNAIHAKIRS